MSRPVELPRYAAIHHVAHATADMGATLRYWRDLLGMRLVYATGGPGARQYFFEVAANQMISFFEWPEVEKLAPHHHGQPVSGPFGFDHLCLAMADAASLDVIADRLYAAGFAVSDIVDHGFVRSLYTHDPNGLPLEFCLPTADVDLHRQPRLLDRQPPPARLEGSEPQAGHWPAPEAARDDERVVIAGEGREDFG